MLDFLVFTSMLLLALFFFVVSVANGFYIGIALAVLLVYIASVSY